MKKMTLTLVALAAGMAAGAAIAQNAQPPKAEPNMQKVLDAMASLKPKPIENLSPEEARKQPSAADAVKKVLSDAGQSTAPEPGVTMKTQTVQGKGGSFPVHIFTPEGKGPFPIIVYYHGGGFVIADTKVYEASVRALAKGAKAIVVSADYRRAPEHKFPTQPEDAFAAYKWAIDNASQFNGDPTRVAVAGESAGGNLATVVSMMARDQKAQLPVHQLLVYPVVDNDMNNASYKKNANAKPLNKAMMGWFFKHYGADPKSPYALPLKATSLKGLPPATVITAEIDPLMTEGKAYADRLEKEGVAVNYRHYTGVTHEFFGMGAVVPKAREAQQFAADELTKAFNAKR
ncbi:MULTISPECIES: alpha/beta hydrolase [Massilia]|jgi:acetyl esterase|uniref:alpha/beta hydrolase n=1 Tax=Massilia TaxID=149698 RepID=UPI001C62E9C7|nr:MULTISPECIES: alpha/beta hydrolase [Massilia]QYG01944.1 alpha/beta hydrolase [Massilia sp. NP310]